MESINELYERLNLHKWWQELLPENSIIFDEDTKMPRHTDEIPESEYSDWNYTQQEVDELIRLIECNLVMPFEGVLKSDNPEEVAIHKKITEYNREKFNQIRMKYSQSSEDNHIAIEKKPEGVMDESATARSRTSQDTCSDLVSRPQCVTSKSEHALLIDKMVTQARIENRIREEQKKHPTLDWIKLAAIKITKQLEEQKNE